MKDGWFHCFSCGVNELVGAQQHEQGKTEGARLDFIVGDVLPLEARGISEETCRKWHYEQGRDSKQRLCHIANYRDDKGSRIAQKLRYKDKSFVILGDGSNLPLYGQWLWRSGGKYVTVTEGEIDALSLSQAMSNDWPVVSVPNGAQSADKSIARSMEWLEKFEHVVLCFDMDQPGRDAVEQVARIIPPGKLKVMNLPRKDANEVLMLDGPKRLVECFWNAKDWRPDGIISGKELTRERLKKAVATGYSMRLPLFDEKTFGVRKGEISMITAASGLGKTTWAREIAYTLHQDYGLRIGNVFLEENNDKSGQAYVALHNDVALKFLRRDPTILSDANWDRAIRDVLHERMWFYDHFGSLDSKALIAKLRFLAVVEKVDFIVLDSISIAVSGTMSDEGERKDIDVLMTRLRSLVNETGVGVISIVHVKRRNQETSFNEGGHVSLTDLRGSGGLEQISDNVYAVERNQQGKQKHRSLIRILKCRETGDTGPADKMDYNDDTGRLLLATGLDVMEKDE